VSIALRREGLLAICGCGRSGGTRYLEPRLLQGHEPAGVLLASLVHLAVGALADLLQLLILILHWDVLAVSRSRACLMRFAGDRWVEEAVHTMPPPSEMKAARTSSRAR